MKIYNSSNGCIMQYFEGKRLHDYIEYCKHIEKAGFLLYSSHAIKENHHTTFYNDSFLIQVYYTACDNVIRMVVDKKTDLYQKVGIKTVDVKQDTKLYQFETDYRTIDCGMCYIIQCVDGSFFIVDSAHMNSREDHIRIYNFLRNLTAAGEKIVIAGWFFSHAHQDHIAKFMDFVKAGFEDCVIEKLYYNFPLVSASGSEKWSDSDKETMLEFTEFIEQHRELSAVRLHTGQHFYVRNLEFEVLATHEDNYPHSLEHFNNSTTVLMMTVDGCKVLFLGDAHTIESEILCKRYGDYLKADIVQIAHHGYSGATVELYEYAAGKVALFPTAKEYFEKNKDRKANKKILELCNEVYIAGNGTACFKLPYILGTATVTKPEINID